MRKARLIIWIITGAVLLGIIFIRPVFSETSITSTVTFHVPYLITLSDGRKVAAGSPEARQETKLATEPKESKESSLAEEKPNIIQQQEEVTSEDNTEVKLITTVCAK